MSIIKNALLKYPDNGELKNELEKYKEYEPVLLSTYEPLKNTAENSSYFSTYVDKYMEDRFGNKYSSSFCLTGGSVSYYLGGKYSYFKGTVACPRELRYTNLLDYAYITVSVDGTRVFTSNPINVDSIPQKFDINIIGAEQIAISWDWEGGGLLSVLGDYATIFDGAFYK